MKHLYNLLATKDRKLNTVKNRILFFLLLLVAVNQLKAQIIYQHDFGSTTISAHPYTTPPPTINGNLSGSSWTNTQNPSPAWTSFAGSAGQAIALNNSGGTPSPTITLSLTVAPGFQANVTSFSFWRRQSGTGATNWSMTINGIAVGSGTVPTTGANTGTLAVASPVNNQTGSLTVVLSLSGASGTGTFRLDDFTLNGTVVAAPTLSVPASGGGSLTSFGNVCINNVAGANTFTITGTALTAANVTVGPLAGFTFSPNNGVFTNTISVAQPGGAFSQTVYVKFSPLLVQSYSGNIPVGGGGAPTINVAAVGVGVNTKPTIDNGTVNSITTSSANVNANINTTLRSATGCTAVTAWGVEYSTVSGFANGAGTAVAGGAMTAGNFTSNLVGLAPPGTTFYFHTYATNAGGTSYGTEGSFTLLNTVPVLSVPSSGAGSLAAFGNVCINTSLVNSFNLSGSVLNGSNITIGALTNHTYSVNAGGPFTNTLTLVNGGAGYSYTGTAITATIYVRLIPTAVTTYNGNIPVSGGGAPAINVATTGAGINSAPTVVTNPAIFVTTTSATLPGNISDPGCGVTIGYGIEYSTAPFTPGTGTVIPSSNLASGNFSVDLSALTPNTTYYYYAYAINAGGTTYGAAANFTTFSVPTKLVIISVTPTSPIALTPFSITVQAQDNLNNPVDVTTDTDIQLSQVGGTGTMTFPGTPAGTMYAGGNTITISGLLYDVIETVGLTATASSGMVVLGTSAVKTFNVVAYTGSNTFTWNNASGSAWLTGGNWLGGVPPGVGGGVNDDLAVFASNAGVTSGGIGINMTTVTGDFNVGAIYANQTYTASGIVSIGNSSGSIPGTLTLHGTALNNVGGVAGNNFAKLFLANYMNNSSHIMEIKNSVGGVQNMTLALIDTAGSMAAAVGDTININVLLTGTKTLTFTGGGTLSLLPSGAATTNTFSGAIIVARGSLLAGSSGAFSTVAPNAITLGSAAANAGRLRLMGNSVTIGGLSTAGTAGNLNIADNNSVTPATLTVNNSTANTFAGSLQNGSTGALNFVKTGVGNLTLSGGSTFTGTTTVNGGSLILARTGGGTLPSNSVISVNGTGILRVSSDQNIKDLTLATGGTLRVDAGVTLTITGVYNPATCNINNLGTIVLQGAALQSFPGVAATVIAMNNLTINDVFGVNLNNSLNITGTLNLTAGTFTVGANTLTINNPVTGTLANFSANNTSSMVIAGTAAGVNIPSVVTQLKSLQVTNTVGSVLQGNLNVSTSLSILGAAGTLYDNQFTLNGTANVTMTGGVLNLEQNTAILPGLTGVYSLTAGTVVFNGVGVGTDAQTVRPINYFNLTSTANGDRILSPTGVIGVANVFTPNVPNNAYTVINSTVDYNKTAAQSVAGFSYYNMTVSGGAFTKTLSGNIDIQGQLELATTTKFALANFNTTLKSNATGTANVAAINTNNSITYGTGQFIVERYIPSVGIGTAGSVHGKSWQFLSVPVSGTQTVKAAWQENNIPLGNTAGGFGTTISSEKAGAVGRGYDFYTPAGPTMKTYNAATSLWVGVDDGTTNTSALPIANKKGYMLFVRGDRSVQTYNAAATVTTLRTSGKIFSPGTDAPLTTAVAATKLESVGNPYASALDFTDVVATSTTIDSKCYVWDPLLPGTNGYGYGGYQLLSSTNSWMPVPGTTANYPTGVPCKKIQSGQAFFVYSTPGGTVSFGESNKISGSNNVYRLTNTTTQRQFLRAWLQGTNSIVADGNIVAFDPAFSNTFDADDAVKIDNATESFGITSGTKQLMIEARSPIADNDTIFYSLGYLRIQSYQLRFAPENLATPGLSAWLVDQFTGTRTAINLSDSSVFAFDVTADPASYAAGRFYIVFKQSGIVPVTFVDISATRNSNGSIDVNWKVANESAIDHYEVERSANGRNFSSIKNAAALVNNGGDAQYNYLDNESLKGDNFYRIRSVGITGNTNYSAIVKVGDIRTAPSISIYPNPVVDKTLNISFVNQPAGEYNLQLSNKLGQVVYKNSITISSSSITRSFALGNEIAPGIYQLVLSSPKNKYIEQVIVK
ncbi:MAG: autotransporter-associated beta strand repeat-containing protein [Ferruginibacter sp.]